MPQVVQSPEGEANGETTHWVGRREGCLRLPEWVREGCWRRSWESSGDQVGGKTTRKGGSFFVDRHLEKESRAALLRKHQMAQELPTHAYAFVML